MSLMSRIISWGAAGARCRTHRLARNVAGEQRQLLSWILWQNSETRFGRDHGFRKVRNMDDFRAAVPVQDFEAHRPYVNRIVAGERMVLSAEEPFMFNITSGTTNTPKLIPITALQDRMNAAVMREWLAAIARERPAAFAGDSLSLVSPEREGMAGDIPFGSTSGRVYRRVPAVIRRHYAIPYAVFELEDYALRMQLALRFSAARNISIIATPNPSTLMQLAQRTASGAEALVRAIRDGTLGVTNADLSRPELRALQERLRPDPARARVLDAIVSRNGTLRPRDLWPGLAQIGCWTGGSVGFQAARLAPAYGEGVALRDLGLLASEARMSLPLRDGTSSGVLTAGTNFYEFVPEEEDPGAPGQHTLLAHELEAGRRYYVLLTTVSGLYRYDINDIIEVTGFHGTCPEIAFVRKGRDMANITGEKLHVTHLLEAVAQAGQAFSGGATLHFRAWPDITSSRYEIAVDPASVPYTDPDWAAFAQGLDSALRLCNLEYASKRTSGRLGAPLLHVMQAGWTERVRLREVHGKRDIQYKWKYLVQEGNPEDKNEIAFSCGGNTE